MTDTPLIVGMLKVPVMREGAGKQYPLGGVRSAEDMAQAMTWLLPAVASRITAQVIAVDRRPGGARGTLNTSCTAGICRSW
jgi:hypothetical protein